MTQLIEIEAHTRGPLFDGRAAAIIDDWLNETVDSLAARGLDQIQFWMNVYFRDPTPYYSTQVTIDLAGTDRVIHDRGIIYGPWLDGSGSRNVTTRFKGYPHWRKTVQYLEQELSPAIIERERERLVRRLNS